MTVSIKQLIEQVRSVDVVLGFDKARNGALVLFYGKTKLHELRRTRQRHRLKFFRFEYDSSVIRKEGEPITQEELELWVAIVREAKGACDYEPDPENAYLSTRPINMLAMLYAYKNMRN